ncbi:MAG: DUF1926 domain-containing protein [Candidatus Margulisbacteria bacterium]|nr:DUF1926 domain-containing protein [Candidatus Margulisiibacteriota bacterium]MBU1021117.1 DUF1926 domain-containing protein [Candidatus Margulisiibacteriota bacterium]MBU1728672.1 DUF1926 domain-containing protein [Candidatus Margulisiibacteriota bacterium]MBU1955123.1 DUF1926 domain-containing protein [Candidatus Margulisiibacteriota bacterium]
MKTINLILGIHCHQPIGTADHIIEKAYRNNYFPFFNALKEHPRIKITAHFSGYLLEWLEKYHGEFIELLQELTRRSQLEFLGGGYYEPILPILPSGDRRGQLKLLTEKINKLFKVSPTGAWLAEQVYAPEIIEDLELQGIEYILLDDFHFQKSQIEAESLFNPFILDRFGHLLKALAIHSFLKQLLPAQPPDKAVLLLKKLSSLGGERVAVVTIDNEIEEQYLSKLFGLIEANLTWISSLRPADYFEKVSKAQKVYVGEGAAREVAEQAGGAFNNYFSKYPEANGIYKKMLSVSKKIQMLKRGKTIVAAKTREEKIREAESELYKAQFNEAYWPAKSGGINLPLVRREAYSHLIAAENLVYGLTHGNQNYCELSILDFDGDGNPEVLVTNRLLNAYFSPTYGGSLFELDYKPENINLLDTFARYKNKGLKALEAGSDKYRKVSLLDHVLEEGTNIEDFRNNKYKLFADFADGLYTVLPRRKSGEVSLRFSREANANSGPLKISKTATFHAGQSAFIIEYEIKNCSDKMMNFLFGTEFCLTWVNKKMAEHIEDIEGLDKIKLFDAKQGVSVSFKLSKAANIWKYPIVTSLVNQGGTQELKQGVVVFPNWKLALQGGESFKVELRVGIEQ